MFSLLFVCLFVCILQPPQPQWLSQQNPAPDVPNAASSRNQKNSVAVLAVVLGTTTVAMKATQSLITRGPRASGSAKVLSQHVGLVFVKVKYNSISLLNI